MIKTSVSIWKKLIGKALNHCTTTATGKGGGDNQYWGSLVSGSSALTTKKIENPQVPGAYIAGGNPGPVNAIVVVDANN